MRKGGRAPVGTMLETVEEYFEGRQWTFSRLVGAPALQTGFRGENGSYRCVAVADQGSGQFGFLSFGPEKVSKEKRPQVAEFLARLNWALSAGSFGMDYDDGEVRLRSGIDVSGDRLSAALLDNVVRANLVVMDAAWPALRALLTGDLTAEEACEMLSAQRGATH